MIESPNDKNVFVWMQMLGFNREDADKGVARYLRQTGFTPGGICALLFHPDIVHQYRGMSEEYSLPPDNCAYYGIPRNDWVWLKERMDVAFSAEVDRLESPTVVWSDTAHERMLAAYIETRRWSAHKFLHELSARGTRCGAAVRSENVQMRPTGI